MAQIIPIQELKDIVRISELCNITKEPIYVTKDGHKDMVIMSMAVYEERFAQIDMYTKIMEGKKQADNGELLDGVSVLAQLQGK